jgi:hypothetical protein
MIIYGKMIEFVPFGIDINSNNTSDELNNSWNNS